ncbi:MAG: hypothetical protein R3A79_05130 [Nannocystaceae bacterium]
MRRARSAAMAAGVMLVFAAGCTSATPPAREETPAPAPVPVVEEAAPTVEEAAPVATPAVVAVAGGIYAVCVAVDDGRVRCLGSDGGEGWPTAPAAIFGEGERRPVELAMSDTELCARRADGSVACRGKYGRDSEPLAGVGVAATAIDAGMDHGCAALADGGVACWGHNERGQLGDGTKENRWEAVRVVGVDDATGLALGWDHSCALREGGGVACWGANELGQLGLRGKGKVKEKRRPSAVPGITDAVAITSGMRAKQTCALRRGGAVSCWGAWGMDSEIAPRRLGADPVELPPAAGVVELAVNTWRICGRTADGAALCWDAVDDDEEHTGESVYAATAPLFPGAKTTSLTSSAFSMQGVQEDMSVRIEGDTSRGMDDVARVEPFAPAP